MSASSKKKLRKEANAQLLTERQIAEQKEAKKLKIQTGIFVSVMILVVIVAAAVMINTFINNSGFYQKNTDAVTIGEHTLNSVELNYYYVDAISETYSNWNSYYSDYTDMYVQMLYGLDVTAPLSTQYYDADKTTTWADYFADLAVSDAKGVYAMYDLAKANGHTLTEEELASVDSTISTTELYGTMLYGYPDLDSYLSAIYGPGADEKSYREYLQTTALAQSYYSAYLDSLDFSDSDIRAYDEEHFDEFSSFSYTTFYVNPSKFLTGGTTDDAGKTTYSDEEKAASVAAAKEAADTLAASGAVDGMILDKAIRELEVYKDDSSAASTSNDDVLYSSLNSLFTEWLADEARQAGDITVIANESTSTDADGKETTTVNGYYVLLFRGRNDNLTQLVNVRHILSQFEGGTTDSTTGQTTYSEAEKKAALDAINKVLDSYNAGDKTEDSFAALVHDNTDDSGSKENGGLYENVYPGQMVTAFNDWCFDEERQPGDVEIVETEYGYHLMYYVSQSETNFRDFMIEDTLTYDALDAWYTAELEKVTAEEINTSRLQLDYVISPNSSY